MSDTPIWHKSIPCACTILALCVGVAAYVIAIQSADRFHASWNRDWLSPVGQDAPKGPEP